MTKTKLIMASISDLIMQQVKSAAGGIEIPSNVKSQVLGGLLKKK